MTDELMCDGAMGQWKGYCLMETGLDGDIPDALVSLQDHFLLVRI